MLTPEQVRSVQSLVARFVSYRQIAKTLRISRSAVASVARGQHALVLGGRLVEHANRCREAESLLANGQSINWVAKQVGIARDIVTGIAVELDGTCGEGSLPVLVGTRDMPRCPKCGARLTETPCRRCRVSIRRRRLFHAVESEEPLRSELEPAEAARVLDTLAMPKGKIRPDRPRARVLRSPGFRFHLGGHGMALVFRVRLHPPISVVESPEPRVESKGGAG